MKIRLVGALLGIVLCGSLFSFANSVYSLGKSELVQADTKTEHKGHELREKITENVAMKDSNIKNSILVTDMIAELNMGENIMFSPLSLNYALGMVSEGATGTSKDILAKYLGTDNYAEFAKEYLEHLDKKMFACNKYAEDAEENIFRIANAIWIAEDHNINPDYEEIVTDNYDAIVEKIDFTKVDKACDKINEYCSEKTEGLIPEIVSPGIVKEETKAVLTNSVYFQSPWYEPWDYDEDFKEEFKLSKNKKVDIAFMHGEADSYYENDKAEAFGKNYKNGLQFIGILPKEEGNFSLEDLDIENLLESEDISVDRTYAKMPRLNFETSVTLSDIMKVMGMEDLFTDYASIDKLTDKPLKIDEVIQKTKLELDENGTRAAAVTAVAMVECTSVPFEAPIIKDVDLDRPFAFVIYDSAYDQIVFAGKIINVE